jgi:hypothetical protein
VGTPGPLASIGKFWGSAGAAKLSGLGWRDSAALGVLMNTRGLTTPLLHIVMPTRLWEAEQVLSADA